MAFDHQIVRQTFRQSTKEVIKYESAINSHVTQ
jgi:hypothetical protein